MLHHSGSARQTWTVPEVRWLSTALEDLQEIKDFYESHEEGLGQRLVREILEIEERLSHFPLPGTVVPKLKPEHRQMLYGNYWIVYRAHPEQGVRIAGVIDCRRDFRNAWRSKRRADDI